MNVLGSFTPFACVQSIFTYYCMECFESHRRHVVSGVCVCVCVRDGLITRPEESYRMWRVVVCDQEISKTRRLKPATGLWKIQPQWVVTAGKQTNKQTLCNVLILCVKKDNKSYSFLGVIAKLRKWTEILYSSCQSVRSMEQLGYHWRNLMKIGTWTFLESLSRKLPEDGAEGPKHVAACVI
jgi:hypothetical protein